jgi:hypothetical protein
MEAATLFISGEREYPTVQQKVGGGCFRRDCPRSVLERGPSFAKMPSPLAVSSDVLASKQLNYRLHRENPSPLGVGFRVKPNRVQPELRSRRWPIVVGQVSCLSRCGRLGTGLFFPGRTGNWTGGTPVQLRPEISTSVFGFHPGPVARIAFHVSHFTFTLRPCRSRSRFPSH